MDQPRPERLAKLPVASATMEARHDGTDQATIPAHMGRLVVVAAAIFFLFLSFLDRRSPVNVDPPYNRTTGASDN